VRQKETRELRKAPGDSNCEQKHQEINQSAEHRAQQRLQPNRPCSSRMPLVQPMRKRRRRASNGGRACYYNTAGSTAGRFFAPRWYFRIRTQVANISARSRLRSSPRRSLSPLVPGVRGGFRRPWHGPVFCPCRFGRIRLHLWPSGMIILLLCLCLDDSSKALSLGPTGPPPEYSYAYAAAKRSPSPNRPLHSTEFPWQNCARTL